MIPIRWKLLIVLLATSLVPLLVVARVGQRSTRDLGNLLANDTRETLINAADRQLRQVVTAQSQYLSDRASKVLLLAELLALEAERLLADSLEQSPSAPTPASAPPVIDGPDDEAGGWSAVDPVDARFVAAAGQGFEVPAPMAAATLASARGPHVVLPPGWPAGAIAGAGFAALDPFGRYGVPVITPAPWWPDNGDRVLFDYQFRADFANPTLDLQELPRYRRLRQPGDRRPVPVSLAHGVFLLVPNVSPWQVAGDIRWLARLTPFYRAIWSGGNENFLWLYTTLESGVHFAYPGHGGYPDDFDPRTRPWYQRALNSQAPVWTVAQLDATTQRAVFTASAPVHRPDGTVAGVSGIDLPVIDVIGRVDLPDDWREHARVMMVTTNFDERDVDALGDVAPAITILARQEYAETTASWRTQFELQTLESKNAEAQARLVSGLLSRQPGTMTWPYEGRAHQVAYAPLPDGTTFLVVLIPLDIITQAAERVSEAAIARTRGQLLTNGIVIATVAVLVILVSFLGSQAVTRPILRLTELARRIARGDFEGRVDIRTRDELEMLGRSFNNMVPQLEERVRMRQSLLLAMDVQQALLPKGPPPLREFEIAGSSIYCDETGGDYFDYIPVGNVADDDAATSLAIAVGDVTGHGASAAMLMTTGRALLRARLQQPGTLAEVVCDVNRLMSADSPYGRFMTLFLLRIDLERQELCWVSAGHEPACFFGPGGSDMEALRGTGIPLGIRSDWRFSDDRMPLPEPGKFILIGTDGIWEARNHERHMFGRDRLEEIIRKHSHGTADELRQAVVDAVEAFQAGAPREDDVTLVVIRRI